MTTAQQNLLTAAGLAPADFSDELGAPFFFATIDGETVAWLPAKADHQHGDVLRASGVNVETVAAPKSDRRRAFERDHCPSF